MVQNFKLPSFSLPKLMAVHSLTIHHNDALTSFELPELTTIGGTLLMSNNNALAQCLIDALVEQIEAGGGIGGDIKTNDNNIDCTCSEVGGVLEATCP
jgi:hypothetical protein